MQITTSEHPGRPEPAERAADPHQLSSSQETTPFAQHLQATDRTSPPNDAPPNEDRGPSADRSPGTESDSPTDVRTEVEESGVLPLRSNQGVDEEAEETENTDPIGVETPSAATAAVVTATADAPTATNPVKDGSAKDGGAKDRGTEKTLGDGPSNGTEVDRALDAAPGSRAEYSDERVTNDGVAQRVPEDERDVAPATSEPASAHDITAGAVDAEASKTAGAQPFQALRRTDPAHPAAGTEPRHGPVAAIENGLSSLVAREVASTKTPASDVKTVPEIEPVDGPGKSHSASPRGATAPSEPGRPLSVPLPPSGTEEPTASESGMPAADGSSRTGKMDRLRLVQRVARAVQANSRDGGVIRMRLHPPELGSLRLEVAIERGVLTARMEADSESARQVLLHNLPDLRERLAGQGVRVEQFDVQVGDTGDGDLSRSLHQPPVHANQGRQTSSDNEPTVDREPAEEAVRASHRPYSKTLNVII